MSEILVITCPSGKQCSLLIPLLYNKGKFHLRLAAHSEASAQKLKAQYPDADVVTTDLQSLSDCRKLLHGATAINAVLPSLHSHEKEIGFNLIDATVAESRREGNVIKHFVFSSVLGTQHRNLLQHDLKSYVEERLFLSPLDCWTILKPTNFLDAYPVAALAAQEHPVLEKWWKPEHANSVIALADLAEASAKVLNEREKHYLAEYPLCSTMPISETEIIQIIEKRIGKKIELKTPSFETGVNKLIRALYGGEEKGDGELGLGLASEGDLRGDLVRDTVEHLILFYNRRGLKGSPNVLRWLLGREPTSVVQWVDGTALA
ncbi:hypothetical protein F9C07_2057511 [Aspergillus flavus]|uniref:NmrA-like domain-containing protein n=2 Tax=Aspergillus flavus TaxID=5059 RepID=A0A7U2MDA4_ASPFN|nr:uncharacterized protein G4B84_002490 [Aspergillus flavus NRRL3357]KAB8248772.1 hypothetical protein BDV35DRAFT_390791 [Aspergillus flavus]KAF7631659.1 hypothetical protein AFLA_012513 [Aspergillus flavus NRRL3357]KAJ1716400.1 putative esterase [Aspergillus flavus]QMW27201.1 hypothetical protein G4B84_002490 [Aspergillus flavus NRRL3357]QRD81562.1 hypothetical protein F9C07_2057511 [Aspergillus flavus]